MLSDFHKKTLRSFFFFQKWRILLSGRNHGYQIQNQIKLLKLEPSKMYITHTIWSTIIVTQNYGKSSQLLCKHSQIGKRRDLHCIKFINGPVSPFCNIHSNVTVTATPTFCSIWGFTDLSYSLRSLILLSSCSPLSSGTVNFRNQEFGSLHSN